MSTGTSEREARRIFTMEERAALDKDLRELHDLIPVIDDAEACGADCGVFREAARQLQEQLTKTKELFMKHTREV